MPATKAIFLVVLAAAICPPSLAAETSDPGWSRILAAKERFVPALEDDEAVLDRETGLVWERVPSKGTADWMAARWGCYNKTVGGRKGWRLPTYEELASLLDPARQRPALPAGHPFENLSYAQDYWTSSYGKSERLIMTVPLGKAQGPLHSHTKNCQCHAWCVRGGQGYNLQ